MSTEDEYADDVAAQLRNAAREAEQVAELDQHPYVDPTKPGMPRPNIARMYD